MIPILSIVGRKKSKKAELVLELAKELKERGYKVGVLKHHAHGDFEIDKRGKSTWRYQKEGVETVAISSPEKFAFVKKVSREIDIDKIAENYFSDVDILLTEGYNLAKKPRIVLITKSQDLEIFSKGEVLAAVEENYDVSKLCDLIVERFL